MATLQSITKLFLELGLNETVWFQMGLFLASWCVLHRMVFLPYLSRQQDRHAKTVGLKTRAQADRERANQLQNDYESFMKAERKTIANWTESERSKIAEEERQIIQRARDQASEDLQSVRVRLLSELESARRELVPQVREYSSQIASRLIGYKVSVPLTLSEGKLVVDAESTVIP